MDNDTYSYNGLLLGADTDYELTRVEGLDPVDSREDLINKSVDHGAYAYAEFLEYRRITLEGFIIDADTTQFQTKINALKAAVVPRRNNLPLSFKEVGQVEKRAYCLPVKRGIKKDREFSRGYTEFAIQFLAGDPRLYADVESSRSGPGVAANAGIIPTFPVITITGGTTNPSMTNSTTGETLSLTLTATSGQAVVVDFMERTIKRDGVSVYDSLDVDSEWWALQPGNNTLAFGGTGTFGTAWRSAWI